MKLAAALLLTIISFAHLHSAHAISVGDRAYGLDYIGDECYEYKKYKVLATGIADTDDDGRPGSYSLVKRTGIAGIYSGATLRLTCGLIKVGQNSPDKAAKEVQQASLEEKAHGEKVGSRKAVPVQQASGSISQGAE